MAKPQEVIPAVPWIPLPTRRILDPMERRRVVDDELDAHFLTFSVDHRRRLLDHDQPKRILLGILNDQLQRRQATCVGFVVMPDHVHAIVWVPERGQLSHFVHEWKGRCSRRIPAGYREGIAAYSREVPLGDRFSKPKYDSFAIYSRKKREEKLNDMHANPARAGLVKRPVDWWWSSTRW